MVCLMMIVEDLTMLVVEVFNGKDPMPLGISLKKFLFNPGSGITKEEGENQEEEMSISKEEEEEMMSSMREAPMRSLKFKGMKIS